MHIDIGKVEDRKWYIDKAFRRGKAKVQNVPVKGKKGRIEKYRYLETIRISTIKDTLNYDLGFIREKFPKPDELDPFYKELFACFVDVFHYERALKSLAWLQQRIQKLGKEYTRLIAKQHDVDAILKVRNTFLARVSSVLDQAGDSFTILDAARRQIKELPALKESMFTVAIAGFPNVGKSTLLSRITDSRPEIASYAFTTKGLMIGFMRHGKERVQVIDTPGSLNRPDKMNRIEHMALLAMQHRADLIVYVFDFTEPYGITEQIKLYKNIKLLGKPMLVYFSKGDLVNTSIIDDFSIKGTYDPKMLRKMIGAAHDAYAALVKEKENDIVV